MSTSTVATMLPEGQSDYECFVSDIRNDFELRVETVQKSAEENTKAYEVYCSELKAQLQASLSANVRLESVCGNLRHQLAEGQKERVKLQERVSELAEYETECVDQRSMVAVLSAMTCLTISRMSKERDGVTYTCTVNDGKVKGHEFTLSLDGSSWEYTYTPISTVTNIDNSFNLNSTMCFPDYMISRFLINLVETTYSDSVQ